jgi:fatty acid desaturase
MEVVLEGSTLDFFSKQVLTGRNVTGGPWMTALMGGLNFQIEHHLFPSMSRPHLRRTRVLVREVCAREGIPYTETSQGRAYAIGLTHLREIGLYSGQLAGFDCPMVGQYRRI